MKTPRLTFFLLLAALTAFGAEPKKKTIKYDPQPWGTWVEADFPFFSSVLDARREGTCRQNLTPRAIVLPLAHDCWVAVDTDLCRVAAIWRGKGVSDKALAPGSYHDPSRKTLGGQFPAPQPEGKLWLGNAILAGWQSGRLDKTDPRSPAPTAEEVGRGPLPAGHARFKAVRLVGRIAVLDYAIGETPITEFWQVEEHEGDPIVLRQLEVGPHAADLLLVAGARSNGPSQELEPGVNVSGPATLENDPDFFVIRVPASAQPARLCVSYRDEKAAPAHAAAPLPLREPLSRWPQDVKTSVRRSATPGPYVVDHAELPTDNPWKRAVRLGDIQFFKDGRAAIITLDGDVWTVRDLHTDHAVWHRFASGLHEPMTLAIRDEQIFAFDRNGIWRLRDTDGDGEADIHELFCNDFAQTADMREFPSTIRLAPNGEFVIAKGGQEATTIGKHNGSVLRISADGKTVTRLGHGFRQPNLSVNLRTGLVLCSDQQGNYVPSTPLHVVRDDQFYGFLSDKLPREVYPAPIADPLTWIPHSVNASGLSQVWLFDAKMGPLNDELVHIGFNRPDLFHVIWNRRGSRPQASVVELTDDFATPPLNGAVNPADGFLYIAGFQIAGWGNTLSTLAGLERVRYVGGSLLTPREVVPTDRGVLLRFDVPLDPAQAKDPDNYALATWHYKRAYTYGSAQYKADGKTGNDHLVASSVLLSRDGKAVFVAVPGLRPVEQLRIGWTIAGADGAKLTSNAYTTPYELVKFDPVAEGFGDVAVDLSPRVGAAKKAEVVSAEEGKRLATMFGCAACHSVGETAMTNVGPSWKGLFGSRRDYVTDKGKKGSLIADEAYIRESILEPNAKKHASYLKSEFAMPSFAGVLSDAQIESLILYIKTLK
jgi:cytochrome c2